jgi:hypothetical protein
LGHRCGFDLVERLSLRILETLQSQGSQNAYLDAKAAREKIQETLADYHRKKEGDHKLKKPANVRLSPNTATFIR